MAVLPWGHSRTQTAPSAEKAKGVSLDWFSRSSAEPSRQAINHLMKQQHVRGESGGSASLRGRSSSKQSQHRSATSVDSRAESTSMVSRDNSIASRSRPTTPNNAGLERSDSTSKSFFQKGGGLLRRKGSKISMAFNASPISGLVSPPRPPSSRAGLQGRDAPTSVMQGKSILSSMQTSQADYKPEEVRRPSISKPYDFAHVMHGDINVFTGLGRIDESDLAAQFDAIQARYRLTTELGEPFPKTPEALTPTEIVNPNRSTTALPQMDPLVIPSTPPPTPPVKDPLPSTPTDVRTSRSTENFSRPTPRSPTTSSNRPSSCHLQHLAPSPLPADAPASVPVKALPQVPAVIHAVSTQDDTARLLISAPLPSPPISLDKATPRHQRQSSSKSSLRHMSTFPSSRHPQTTTTSQDGQLLGIKEEDALLGRPHSDYEVMQHMHRRNSAQRSSLFRKPLGVEDWEVAIDSAWDFEDGADALSNDNHSDRPISTHSRMRNSYLTIEQPPSDNGSLPSTPLMTMNPPKHIRVRTSAHSPPLTEGGDDSALNNRNSSSLVGLGIETGNSTRPVSRASRPPTLEVNTSEVGRPNASPRLTRSAYSALSHSSSQESIILSIASSIMSTQRSSISSVSVSDYAQAGKPDRSSVTNSANSPLLNVNFQKPARPESSCLPSALLQQVNHEVQKAARPDSTCLPSVSMLKRNSGVPRSNRPESACLSKDVPATFPTSENISHREANAGGNSSMPEASRGQKTLSTLSSDDQRGRVVAGSRNSASHRLSAASSGDGHPTTRQRSNTQNSRSRGVRASYSLFPVAGSSASASSNIDIEGVAS